jgi:hypothetical protein
LRLKAGIPPGSEEIASLEHGDSEGLFAIAEGNSFFCSHKHVFLLISITSQVEVESGFSIGVESCLR